MVREERRLSMNRPPLDRSLCLSSMLDVGRWMCSVENIMAVREPLPSECVGQHLEGCFGNHLLWFAGAQCRTHCAFERTEAAFDCPAPAESSLLETLWRHLGTPLASNFAISASLDRGNDTLHAPAFPTFRMDPLRVISRVCKQPLGLHHRSGLTQ